MEAENDGPKSFISFLYVYGMYISSQCSLFLLIDCGGEAFYCVSPLISCRSCRGKMKLSEFIIRANKTLRLMFNAGNIFQNTFKSFLIISISTNFYVKVKFINFTSSCRLLNDLGRKIQKSTFYEN